MQVEGGRADFGCGVGYSWTERECTPGQPRQLARARSFRTEWCRPQSRMRTARRLESSARSELARDGPCRALCGMHGGGRQVRELTGFAGHDAPGSSPSSWPETASWTCKWQSEPPATKRSCVGCSDAESTLVPRSNSLRTSRLHARDNRADDAAPPVSARAGATYRHPFGRSVRTWSRHGWRPPSPRRSLGRSRRATAPRT